MRIRTLIVDDEPIARRGIRRCLEREPGVEIAGECSHGREAIAAIRELAPDLVFLDIQMPEVDGFAVLEAVGADHMPVVIFVTAYDQYAVKAFEVHALDYLLKPFDAQRFHEALTRARAQIEGKDAGAVGQQILGLLRDLNKPKESRKYVRRVTVRTGGRISVLDVEEIDWLEATGNYVNLHVGSREHLVRETVNRIENKLDPGKFLRISRSTIVNTQRIKEIHPHFNGACTVLLRSGTQLASSRRFRAKIEEFLKG